MCQQRYGVTACLTEDSGKETWQSPQQPRLHEAKSTGSKESLQLRRKALSTTGKKTLTPDAVLKRKTRKQQSWSLYFSLSPSGSGTPASTKLREEFHESGCQGLKCHRVFLDTSIQKMSVRNPRRPSMDLCAFFDSGRTG